MNSIDLLNIQNGILSSDYAFWILGGAIIVVLAGIWGFKQVFSLLESPDDINAGMQARDHREYEAVKKSTPWIKD